MLCRHRLSFLRLLWASCLLFMALVHAPAVAQDHIFKKAYWTDTTGSASFEQARSASYTPYSGVLSKGFSQHVQWVRLKVDGVPTGTTDSLVLRIRPVFLDDITLYDPLELDRGQAARTTGDTTTLASAEFESLNYAFLIPAQSTPRDIWLRLSTTSTQLMHVEVLTPREMLRQEHSLWLVYSALLALILSFLVWVLLAWLRDRDPVNGMFVLRQTVILIFTASFLGYHRILLADVLAPISQDMFYSWLVLLSTASSFAFEYRFLREYHLPRWGHVLLSGLLVASASLAMLMLLGYKLTALGGNMALNGVGLISLMLVSFSLQTRPTDAASAYSYYLPKPAVVGYYVTIVLVLAFSILPSLGVLQGNMLSVYGVLLYGLISGLFMTSLLVVRSRQLERIRVEVANSLFLSREQLAFEKQRRQDQTQLLSMLMHELKTPLAVIDMAVSTRTSDGRTADFVTRAVNNIKGILDRCIQTDRMVDREFKLQTQTFVLSDQLQQWLQDRQEGAERVRTHIAPDLRLSSDLQCIQIIANNLLDNAFKHGNAQASVDVHLIEQVGDDARPGLLMSVSSRPGPSGWPDAEQLFAKYYRSSSAQRQSGTGLGLYLSHKLAAQLGGALRYSPDAEHIRFELWLPT